MVVKDSDKRGQTPSNPYHVRQNARQKAHLEGHSINMLYTQQQGECQAKEERETKNHGGVLLMVERQLDQ